ncbi:ATP-binding protein [Fischerella sp. PCC 9605]|uniref:ATP-binding protein n=1 Tax=Fischerella sp. PCC 9605 TaxID=1173024 RepID=UPI0004797CF5|nr:ATP-binding protein [Fischerella sp. PCC 9605]
MTENHVSSTFSPADREAVIQAIATIKEKLPLLEDKDRVFVSQVVEAGTQYSDFLSTDNPQKKRRTLQEIVKQHQQLNFVGREEEITLFRQNLELPLEDDHRRFIFNVAGAGGVGKSSLLRQFRQIAEHAKLISAYTDELEKSIPEVMSRLAQQLEQQGYKLVRFNESYQAYCQILQELETDCECPQGFSAFVERTLPHKEVYLTQQIPGTDVVLEFADRHVEVTQGDWTAYAAKKLASKDELRLLQEAIAVLTPLFLEDLWKVAEKSDIALFFDNCDRTEEFLDPWLRDILDGRYGDVPSNILLIIAGRQELDKNHWRCYEGSMVRLVLKPFTEEEARQYLSYKDINDNEIIDVILRLSEGLPLLVATLAVETPDDTSQIGDANGMVVERFLKWMKDPQRRQGVLNAALPRYLYRDVLVQLRSEEEAEELLNWLQQMPFVKAHPNGWVYHDVAKTLMLRHKRLSSAQSWTHLQGKLADYYDSLANDLQLDEEKKWCDRLWQSHKLNVLYHRLCQAPHKYLSLALNEFIEALQKHYKFAQCWAETIVQAGKDSDATEVQRWGEKLLQGLKAWKEQEYEVTAQMFTALIEQGRMDRKWRALAMSFRGAIYYISKRYDEALKNLNQAITLDPTLDSAIELQGHVYSNNKHYSDAIKSFDRLIKLDPNHPRAIAQRGYIYQLIERYDQALIDFNRALELDPNYTWAKIQQGYNYLLVQCYAEAVRAFDDILKLEPEHIRALLLRGVAYYLMGRYGEAIADFDRVLKYEPDNIQVRTLRGTAYYLLGNYIEALPDFNRILELDRDRGKLLHVYVLRGETYRQMKCYAEALQDFDCAIELDADNAGIIARRGETYQLLGSYDQALKDFNHVLELDQNNDKVFVSRGYIYLMLKQYDEAFADVNRAVKLNSNDDWYLYLRALAYQALKQPRQARADFVLAIKIAKKRYEQDTQDWRNTLNIALYYLAVEFYPTVESLYKYAIAKGASQEYIRKAIHDLDDFLTIFPERMLVKCMRELLQSALN